ncbi:TPA: recombinase family protein [Legionella pneumophila]|uniref:recombinase family protein n=1 Tax=Legionellaceae TaxID=444 RepID=UPI0005A92FD1|nr:MULTISPECIES: recombinase family protein [Legionellaceae]HAT8894482.1 resolvase [Legionella pneumophila subsp. pneumophila]MCW8403892.1 recombinase family protein [Legionella pneumophila]MCW8407350.1 recombinase family protein [Legionella pneumophila]MCW8430067.1 recombinase family protein [Legionella pneumophila]MCW8459029.1 recombinase family protein [Legionella pneumophila]
MIYGYVRVSTQDQSVESQKNSISRYCIEQKLMVDEWIELEMSSRKSTTLRRIDELLDKLSPDDVVIASELSRLGRSIKETLNTIETIIQDKQSRLILIKQNLDLNPNAKSNVANKVLITIFSMLAELERDFISERTKEGLRARAAKGIKLGKPKGVIQASMYDKDKEKILHLYQLGVPIQKIISTHLGYGKYLSLKAFLNKSKDLI